MPFSKKISFKTTTNRKENWSKVNELHCNERISTISREIPGESCQSICEKQNATAFYEYKHNWDQYSDYRCDCYDRKTCCQQTEGNDDDENINKATGPVPFCNNN